MSFTFEPEDETVGKINFKLDIEDNVILFPKEKFNSPPQTLEEVKNNVVNNQQTIAIDLAYSIVTDALLQMSHAGFHPFKYLESSHDMMFCLESIKAMILRTCNIEYPFHEIAKETIEIENPEAKLAARRKLGSARAKLEAWLRDNPNASDKEQEDALYRIIGKDQAESFLDSIFSSVPGLLPSLDQSSPVPSEIGLPPLEQ